MYINNSRLFSFGGSFTNYHWPTYANILAKSQNKFTWDKGKRVGRFQ
jgi:hypothetical protein